MNKQLRNSIKVFYNYWVIAYYIYLIRIFYYTPGSLYFIKEPYIPELLLGDKIIQYALIQGGMGPKIAGSGMAAAVANAGALGVISAVLNDPPFSNEDITLSQSIDRNVKALENEIDQFYKLAPGKALGVNIMKAAEGFEELFQASIDKEVDIIFVGSALLTELPNNLKPGGKTKIGIIVSRSGATKIVFKSWWEKYGYVPDMVVVEGPLAGGHIGLKAEQIKDAMENPNSEFRLENLLKQNKQIVDKYRQLTGQRIILAAAGGIWSGSDIHRFMSLGADAVQMGTRFVTTFECDAADEFKDEFVKCSKKDIMIVKTPVGLEGRVIRNSFVKSLINKKIVGNLGETISDLGRAIIMPVKNFYRIVINFFDKDLTNHERLKYLFRQLGKAMVKATGDLGRAIAGLSKATVKAVGDLGRATKTLYRATINFFDKDLINRGQAKYLFKQFGRSARNLYRAIINLFDRNLITREATKCQLHCLKTCAQWKARFCLADVLLSAQEKGKQNKSLLFIGANGYRCKKIVSVQSLITRLNKEYARSCKIAQFKEKIVQDYKKVA